MQQEVIHVLKTYNYEIAGVQVPQWLKRLGSIAIANNAVHDYKATITGDS